MEVGEMCLLRCRVIRKPENGERMYELRTVSTDANIWAEEDEIEEDRDNGKK